jgi:uncharacterized protein YprB with RNaseH-like and TPR domain
MKALRKQIEDILFLDIETVGAMSSFDELPSELQAFWLSKSKILLKDNDVTSEEAAKLFVQKGAIYSEFAKIVCISIGFLIIEDKEVVSMRTKSFFGPDEKAILSDFVDVMNNHFDQPKKQYLCGHNVKEFDVPFICRRLIINGIKIPKKLDISGKKPWEIDHIIDTMTMWRFGDYKNYTSLALLAHVLSVPTPKDDIDGSMVHTVFYDNNDSERIARYCEKDVVTSAKVLLKLLSMDVSEEFESISKTDFPSETDDA